MPASASPGRVVRVAVVSDRPLVAEAFRVALAGLDLETSARSWELRGDPGPGQGDAPDVLLLLCDLADPRLWMSRRLDVLDLGHPALVLTPTPRGLLWGAVLAAGAGAVLPDSATRREVTEALAELIGAGDGPALVDRIALLEQWREEVSSHPEVLVRLRTLDADEVALVRLLASGLEVGAVAAALGIGQEAVRARLTGVQHRLGVRSPADVAAAVSWLPGPRVPGPRRPPP